MANDLKFRIAGKTARFIRSLRKHEDKLYVHGECIFCGAFTDELHEIECPMYRLEGVCMDLNHLFYQIKTAEERANHPEAL